MTNTKKKGMEISIPELLAKAAQAPENPDLYVNHAQIVITNNEIVVEFYYLSPTNIVTNLQVKATLKQRIILPHALGKGLATALANVIASYEDDNETVLPNNRIKAEDEKIVIWP